MQNAVPAVGNKARHPGNGLRALNTVTAIAIKAIPRIAAGFCHLSGRMAPVGDLSLPPASSEMPAPMNSSQNRVIGIRKTAELNSERKATLSAIEIAEMARKVPINRRRESFL